MQLTLYIIGNKAIIPTVARTQAGYYLEVEPVTHLDLADPKLSEAMRKSLDGGNPIVPTSSRATFPEPVVLRYTGAKSWKKFAELADCWTVTERNGTFVLGRSERDADGVYWGAKEKLTIPLDSSGKRLDADVIIDAIRSDTLVRRSRGAGTCRKTPDRAGSVLDG